MTPIFDKDSLLSGWFDGQNLYDLNMDWAGFITGGNAFESGAVSWLGQVRGDVFLDRDGKPVAWMNKAKPAGTLKPLRPLKPLKPLRPLKPLKPIKPLKPLVKLTPTGGWSRLSYQDWISGR